MTVVTLLLTLVLTTRCYYSILILCRKWRTVDLQLLVLIVLIDGMVIGVYGDIYLIVIPLLILLKYLFWPTLVLMTIWWWLHCWCRVLMLMTHCCSTLFGDIPTLLAIQSHDVTFSIPRYITFIYPIYCCWTLIVIGVSTFWPTVLWYWPVFIYLLWWWVICWLQRYSLSGLVMQWYCWLRCYSGLFYDSDTFWSHNCWKPLTLLIVITFLLLLILLLWRTGGMIRCIRPTTIPCWHYGCWLLFIYFERSYAVLAWRSWLMFDYRAFPLLRWHSVDVVVHSLRWSPTVVGRWSIWRYPGGIYHTFPLMGIVVDSFGDRCCYCYDWPLPFSIWRIRYSGVLHCYDVIRCYGRYGSVVEYSIDLRRFDTLLLHLF